MYLFFIQNIEVLQYTYFIFIWKIVFLNIPKTKRNVLNKIVGVKMRLIRANYVERLLVSIVPGRGDCVIKHATSDIRDYPWL